MGDMARSPFLQFLDPTYVQKFRLVPLTVFEILGFKLKNKNDKKKWTFCHISQVSGAILTKFYVHINIDLSYHPVLSKVDYNLVKVEIGIFECTGKTLSIPIYKVNL